MHKFFCEACLFKFDRGEISPRGRLPIGGEFYAPGEPSGGASSSQHSAETGQRNGLVRQYATRALASWLIKDRRGRIAGLGYAYRAKVGRKAKTAVRNSIKFLKSLALPRGLEPLFSP
jgi:hypothetical protein